MEEAATRERRAQARAALTPQTTGASEKDLIDTRMQRLKLEGTPRVKRTKRQPAPPISPIPATTDFSDFMLPTDKTAEPGDLDYGTLAQKMMNDIFAANGMKEGGREGIETPSRSKADMIPTPEIQIEEDAMSITSGGMPVSPSPITGDLNPLSGSPEKFDNSEILSPTADMSKRFSQIPRLPSLPRIAEPDFETYTFDEQDERDDEEELEGMSDDEIGDGDRTINLNDTPRL